MERNQTTLREEEEEPQRTQRYMEEVVNGFGKVRKGGFRAASFVYGMVGLENMGFVANMVSLVLYFTNKMYFDLPTAANTYTNLMGSTYLLSFLGGFVSDTYLTRFHTCLAFGALEILALSMMTIQAKTAALLPRPCGKPSCVEGGVAVFFYSSLCFMGVGVGGVRGSLPALGADQFRSDQPKALATYFNGLLLSSVTGASLGVTLIVWVSTNRDNHGWWKGFLMTALAAFAGLVSLSFGKIFYRMHVPGDSPLLRILQVVVVAVKNRRRSVPESSSELYETSGKDEAPAIAHTDQFRCLDKAAIVPADQETISPWRVCTVTQVEEVKILTRMLPIIASTIILNTCMAQLQTFSVQQGYRMDTHLGRKFRIPSASIPVIPLLFMVILIPVYDRILVPCISRYTKHPTGITQLQRVGIGLALSAASMAIAAAVEVKRRKQSLLNPTKPISLFWLGFQYAVFGIADVFTLVGLLEFFYKEAPIGMKSLATSFTYISQSFGYFLSSFFVEAINLATRRADGRGWLSGQDLDGSSLDLFYWFLAALSTVNFFSYLYWSSWYKCAADDRRQKDAGKSPEECNGNGNGNGNGLSNQHE
ncbi:hypothetical protein M569_12600 [Genlisea aurea]|uniref:Nitrate transporter n=1 Tax=Genlisea aurea TaxID=192259 RepID=S8DQW4_9LAMI|nr:hypothetical protein M569_12600 [Genlisea aurea]